VSDGTQRQRDETIRQAAEVVRRWPGLRREPREAYYALLGAGADGDRGLVFLGPITMAETILSARWGCSVSAVRRRLASLTRAGLATVEHHQEGTRIRVALPTTLPVKSRRPKRLRTIGRRDPQRCLPFLDDHGLAVYAEHQDEPKTVSLSSQSENVFASARHTEWEPGGETPRARSGSGTGSGTGTGAAAGQEYSENHQSKEDLLEVLLADASDYQEALQRPVVPLPPGRVAYGAFRVLREDHLAKPRLIVRWFRQQLGSPRPVAEGNEGELLLVLATAMHAVTLPAKKIRKNRVALFVGTVKKRAWREPLPMLPDAQAALDALLRKWPELLTGDWPAEAEAPAPNPSDPIDTPTPAQRVEAARRRQEERARQEQDARERGNAKHLSPDELELRRRQAIASIAQLDHPTVP
jgi:hypothetical protein